MAGLPRLIHARLWFGIVYALLALVALLSLLPAPDALAGSDKLLHFLAYAGLSGLFSLLVCEARSLWWVALGLIGYGVLIELLQGLTGYRQMELYDMLANSAGVLAGMLLRLSPLPRIVRGLEARLS